ncbi:type III toxin-antitoxin system ToxN/AbiQ family toxin [Gallibacterium genomosp. 1]|nr:type III toxin-antitoxin system ToxN/AbiQ family toxin [Gallibacterium genomosp. 1]
MSDRLKLYRVTDHYLDFLREIEPKIPANKDNGKKRP